MDSPPDIRELERLVEERLPEVLRFAVRLTGDPAQAEDLVQDSLVRALQGWKTFRGEASARTWLYRIVINVFRDRIRQSPRELPEEVSLRRSTDDPSHAAQCNELQGMIAWQVSALPPRQREVLVMICYEGFNVEQTAAALGISQENVHATLHHARTRLRAALARYLS